MKPAWSVSIPASVEPEIVRVRRLPDTDEQVRAFERLAGTVLVLDRYRHAVGRLGDLGSAGPETKIHALFLERVL